MKEYVMDSSLVKEDIANFNFKVFTKKLKIVFLCLLGFSIVVQQLDAQPFVSQVYPIRIDSNVIVGTTTNYCLFPFTLKIHLYKPVGDHNKNRPVVIFSNPGGPMGPPIANRDINVEFFAKSFASRGYVSVILEYRRGVHLYPFEPGLPLCLNPVISWLVPQVQLLYSNLVAGDEEFVRGVYRAVQDIKTVVKFMKTNHEQDSTSVDRVFLSGHSGGAVVTLYAAFMNDPSKKPAACGDILPAKNPDWQDTPFQICGPNGIDDKLYNLYNNGQDYENPNCYQRPDLGRLEFDIIKSNEYDASIRGIATMAGGIRVQDTTVLTGINDLPIFMYHQTGDYLVPFDVDTLYTCFEKNFNFLYPAIHHFMPLVGGSNWLNQQLTKVNWAGRHKLWAYGENQQPPDVAGLWCMLNHDFKPTIEQVADSIAVFFAEEMNTTNHVQSSFSQPKIKVYPNPSSNLVHIDIPFSMKGNFTVELWDFNSHRCLRTVKNQSFDLDVSQFKVNPGLYYLQLKNEKMIFTEKLIISP